MTARRRSLGRWGEELACRHLRRRGWEIVERNARTRHGELDIVARDGPTLVFVEVKTARAGARSGPERPALAVGPRKRGRLRRLARAWLAERPGGRYAAIRFDVIGITAADAPTDSADASALRAGEGPPPRADPGAAPQLEHIENAL